ncbi:MAG: hypothetical protein V4487_02695 [Chlamydiota bacterium]
MAIPFEKLLQETFSDLQNLTPDKLQGLIQETMKVFSTLQEKIHSNDPKEREEALNIALALKESLQTQAESVCEKMGLDPSQLSAFAENATNFSAEEWENLSGVKKDLDSFRQQFAPKTKETIPLKKSKKGPKTWLVG